MTLTLVYSLITIIIIGIGGFAWNGSILMASFLQRIDFQSSGRNLHVHELGCGSAMPSILLALQNANGLFTVSDGEIDLADLNVQFVSKQILACDLDSVNQLDNVKVFSLSWGCLDNSHSELAIRQHAGRNADIIIGCEVACLRRQQSKLLMSIQKLFESPSRQDLLFLSFDGAPPATDTSADGQQSDGNRDRSVVTWASRGEQEIHEKLTNLGYKQAILFTGTIVWRSSHSLIDTHTNHQHQYTDDDMQDFNILRQALELFYTDDEFKHYVGKINECSPVQTTVEEKLRKIKLCSAVIEDLTHVYENNTKQFSLPYCRDAAFHQQSCNTDDIIPSNLSHDVCHFCHNTAGGTSIRSTSSSSSELSVKKLLRSSTQYSGPNENSERNNNNSSSELVESDLQHISVYYLPSSTSVCKICGLLFFRVLN